MGTIKDKNGTDLLDAEAIKKRWKQCMEELYKKDLNELSGEGNGNPLQYSCLENTMDGGAWWASIYGVAESDTTEAT